MDGAGRIAAERKRQIEHEGWTPEHDDDHDRCELLAAARCYLQAATHESSPSSWPWDAKSWRPSPDPIRNLEKAGALIAAEIDRLQRRP